MRALPLVIVLGLLSCDPAPPRETAVPFGLSVELAHTSITRDPLGVARAQLSFSAPRAGVVSVFRDGALHSILTCQQDPRCLEAGEREVQLSASASLSVMASSTDRVCLLEDTGSARCARADLEVEVFPAARVTLSPERALLAPGEAALLTFAHEDAARVAFFIDDSSGRRACDECQVTLDGARGVARVPLDAPATVVALAVSRADDEASFEDLAARAVLEVEGFPRVTSLAFDRAAAAAGDVLTLSWSSADADSVLFAGNVDSRVLRDCENQGPSGSCTIEASSEDLDLRMIASRDGVSSASLGARVDIGEAPSASLDVDQSDEKRVLVTWSSSAAESITLVDLGSGEERALAAVGGLVLEDLTLPTRMTLIAKSRFGEARASAEVRRPTLPALPVVRTEGVALGPAFDLHTSTWSLSWSADDAESVEIKVADAACAQAGAFDSLGVFDGARGDFAFDPEQSGCVELLAKNPFGQASRLVDVTLASPEFEHLFAPALGEGLLPSEFVFVTGALEVAFAAPGAQAINLELAPLPPSRDCDAATEYTDVGAFGDSGALSLESIARDKCLRATAQNPAGRRAARTVRLVESPDLSAALGNVSLSFDNGGEVFVESDVAGLVSLRVEVITLDANGSPLGFSEVCNLESLELDPESSIPAAQIACRDVWDAQDATDCESACRVLPEGARELVYAIVGRDSEGQYASTSVNHSLD